MKHRWGIFWWGKACIRCYAEYDPMREDDCPERKDDEN